MVININCLIEFAIYINVKELKLIIDTEIVVLIRMCEEGIMYRENIVLLLLFELNRVNKSTKVVIRDNKVCDIIMLKMSTNSVKEIKDRNKKNKCKDESVYVMLLYIDLEVHIQQLVGSQMV